MPVSFVIVLMESFRSTFMLNVEWSCDLKRDINVHHERSAVILDQCKRLTEYVDFEWHVWASGYHL